MNRRSMLIGGGSALLLAGAGVFGWRSSVGSMADYDGYAGRLRAQLPKNPEIANLIRCATLAANSHNTQPWRFRVGERTIDILPDFSRGTPAVDPDNHHLFVSLGCAAENMLIAATATGRPGDLEIEAGSNGVRYRFSAGQAGRNHGLPLFSRGNRPVPNMTDVPCLPPILKGSGRPPQRQAST